MIKKPKELEDFFTQTIEQSVSRHQLDVSPEARNYIAGMLERFADSLELFPEQQLVPITFQYQRVAEQADKLQRTQLQQELGDHCLFLVGYFYDFVQKAGQGQVQYHSQIGSSAYQQIGRHPFEEIAHKFKDLYIVIGDLHLPQMDEKKVMEIYGRWETTQDRYYASLLLGKGIVPQRIKKNSN